MQPGPGSLVPSTVEISEAVSIPCAMRPWNGVPIANSSFRCTGLVSPDTPANIRMSASVIVLPNVAVIPGLLLLAGCAAGVPETPQEREARFQAACNQAGFKADTEAYKLCLLIQQ